MTGIAVGVPIYCRESALEQFLRSVPAYVSTAYVADNGPEQNQDRSAYDLPWPFDLEVLHLDHDVGIGACRAAITDAAEEYYLWMGDCDMEFSRHEDLKILTKILYQNDELGGVAGWLFEGGTVRSGARDLTIAGDSIVKTASDFEPVRHTDGIPWSTWEFIPQAALFQTAVFDDYDYDPDMGSSEHLDFFLGQQQTDWKFASTPAVLTQHHRNIDTEYRESVRGQGHADYGTIGDKWGVHASEVGAAGDWAQVRDRSVVEHAFDVFKRATPPSLWIPVKRAAKRAGVA